ncbi:SDR family oxidoreductase [Streptomyces sp. Vc74B-19]|uniref:SDR family NAD(P)-dependent oxidoreductase n=1 Tax=unclassified Streptomyces TaxID=2593676 RepID=UPI001BFCB09B|nr:MULTISPECIES: SDR family oxidoreductase [unclassified Streptomyces]MBT3162665.1 SDR family oxidoreductase [Streptomyces sp. Vc74B-19]MCO4694532.1 SDR family oxidoreductase [Streptomyces sp. RO-S4]MDU0301969.1 SDR family oxidoreductase [Streptomyces sp. PAL114]
MGQQERKTAVITGGSTGIGLATAVRLADEGAYVFITGRREAELKAAVETIGTDRATAVVGDISKPEDLDRLYEAVQARGTGVDVLVANAGVGSFVTLEETTEEHFDQIFDVNVRGTVFTVKKALPLLKDGASVILVGSTASTRGVAGFGAYSASKAAVRAFARAWSVELKDRDIRVNVVSPAWIETPGGMAAFGDEETIRAVKETVAATVPKGRFGRPEEAAALVAFLASEQSSYIVGVEFHVDGGANQI